MPQSMRVEIVSPPDRELLCAHIMLDGEQWAEVNQEHGNLELEIYGRRDGEPWIFDFECAIGALNEAARRLQDR